MSWLIAVDGNDQVEWQTRLRKLTSQPIYQFSVKNKIVFAGGNSRTCFGGELPDGVGNWVVCGLGVVREEERLKWLGCDDWAQLCAKGPEYIQANIRGQYAGVIISEHGLIGFTDPIGSRDLFSSTFGKNSVISSRLDWINVLQGSARLNPSAFGERWHFFYQLSHDCVVKDVDRFGPGAILRHDGKRSSLCQRRFQPQRTEDLLPNSVIKIIEEPLSIGTPITLGLSGGLDSRVMLAVLSHNENKNWDTHTFGERQHPDALVAALIANDLGVAHKHYDIASPTIEELIASIEEYSQHAMMLRPATSAFQLQNYRQLARENSALLIDGSFAEIGRRQMFNRIVWKAGELLRDRRFEDLDQLVSRFRADIFDDELVREMRMGLRENLRTLGEAMPDPSTFGVENWADLLIMKHGIPNVNAAEQARMDHDLPSYLPFMQTGFFDSVLSTPLRLRRNGRAYRGVIRSLSPQLTKYPLVGADFTYPFAFTTIPAALLRRIKAKLGRTYASKRQSDILLQLKPFVCDLLLSADRASVPLYGKGKVERIVNEFYGGNMGLAGQLDWLLAFEVWRRQNHVTG